MKVLTSSVLTVLPLFVVAHGDHGHHYARQVSSSAVSTSSGAPPSSILGNVPSATVSGSVTTATTATMSTPNITVSLLATNPTAVPLASIVSNQPSGPTIALFTTATPGATPTFLPGFPTLPTAVLIPSNYPAMDVVPPTDSELVQQWIQEVYATGLTIPNIPQTNPGGCPNNSAAVASAGPDANCWWTCGGCAREYDITACPDVKTWGLTYDDGPSFYTPNLLNYLDDRGLKATFFVVGSRVLQFPKILEEEYLLEHHIAVHTWSHPSLTTLSNEQIIAELGWSKKIIKDVLGVTPNIMRPPYGDIDDRVRAISIAMGLTPSIWTRVSPTVTFDTGDFNIRAGTTTVQQVLQNWENILGNVSVLNTGFIVLEHDLFEQTVEIATGYILPDALAHNPPFNIEPIVSCLHMPLSNAYIETNNNVTNVPIINGTFVTTIHPTATGVTGAKVNSANAHLSIGSGLMFMTTIVTLLAGVIVVRF